MTTRRGGLLPLLVLLLSGGFFLTTASLRAADPPPPVSIFFETQLPYFYEGDALDVAVTVKNVSERTVDNGKGIDLLGGLQVEDARGAKLRPAEGLDVLVSQPKSLEVSAFFGRVLTVNEIFPGLKKAGNYRLTWKGQGATSNVLILHVVEQYDERTNYRARIETDFGPIVVEFAKDTAPRHVRNFIDLARQGFYNGNQFHRVMPGQAIVGGSPTGELTAGSGYNLKPELRPLPVEAGTVLQVRNRETGVDDSGSHFMITAIPIADFQGRLTVLGKVVDGLDTVKTICQVPTVRNTAEPPGMPERPVKPVLIRKLTVSEVPEKASGKPGERKSDRSRKD